MPVSVQSLQKAGPGVCSAQRQACAWNFSPTLCHMEALAAGHWFSVYIQFMTTSLSHLWLFVIFISIKIFILNQISRAILGRWLPVSRSSNNSEDGITQNIPGTVFLFLNFSICPDTLLSSPPCFFHSSPMASCWVNGLKEISNMPMIPFSQNFNLNLVQRSGKG